MNSFTSPGKTNEEISDRSKAAVESKKSEAISKAKSEGNSQENIASKAKSEGNNGSKAKSEGNTGSKAKSEGNTGSSEGSEILQVNTGQRLAAIYLVAIFYGGVVYFVTSHCHLAYKKPLDAETTPPYKFSEGRAMRHVVKLATDIGARQVGTPGLGLAEEFLRSELGLLKGRASTDLRFEIEDFVVSGSFNLKSFLTRSMTMAYQNLTNIAVRISAKDGDPNKPSVLLSAHYDSAPKSNGASDCASCVACLLEVLRQIIDSNFVPASPVIFLFNGGEEVFLKAAHGFINHPWCENVGAMINLEASGSDLPDTVIQSGPGTWAAKLYGKSAAAPMATVISQDVFPYIPGDTDYRIFCQDFDDIPGLDMVTILKSQIYHTPYDTPENMVPGVMQSRGDNLLPLIDAFTKAPVLKGRAARRMDKWSKKKDEGTPVFFDFWGIFMVYYSRPVAFALHWALVGAIILVPHLTNKRESGTETPTARYDDLVTGGFTYMMSWFLAILFPVLVAVARVAASKKYMTWFASPITAFAMFVPSSIAGLLVPHVVRNGGKYAQAGDPLTREKQVRIEWSNHWGGIVGANAFIAVLITWGGGGSGFLPFWWAMFSLSSLYLFRLCQSIFGRNSPLALLGYFLPAVIPTAYCAQFGSIIVYFLMEKSSVSGTFPLPLGPYIADIIIASAVGVVTALVIAPLVPPVSQWLGHPHIIRMLIYGSLVSAMYSCTLFPYSLSYPKHVVIQRVYWTQGETTLLKSEYNLATGDSNDGYFVFEHVPQLGQVLNLGGGDLRRKLLIADRQSIIAWYPVSEFMERSLSFETPLSTPPENGFKFPQILLKSEERLSPKLNEMEPRKRTFLELNFGSTKRVWSSVLNVTGPLMGWSLAEGVLPTPESSSGGPPSFIIHFSGSDNSSWDFWIEALGDSKIRIDLAVLDQEMDPITKKMGDILPPWIAAGLVSSYLSTYYF